jgi:hypothetical protein
MRHPSRVFGLAGAAAGLGLLLFWQQRWEGGQVVSATTSYCELDTNGTPSSACQPSDWILASLEHASRYCDLARQTIGPDRRGDLLCHYIGYRRIPR